MTEQPRNPLSDLSIHYGAGQGDLVLSRDEVGEIIDYLQGQERLSDRQHAALVALLDRAERERRQLFPTVTLRQLLTLWALFFVVQVLISVATSLLT